VSRTTLNCMKASSLKRLVTWGITYNEPCRRRHGELLKRAPTCWANEVNPEGAINAKVNDPCDLSKR
jgi:hypothetical protein